MCDDMTGMTKIQQQNGLIPTNGSDIIVLHPIESCISSNETEIFVPQQNDRFMPSEDKQTEYRPLQDGKCSQLTRQAEILIVDVYKRYKLFIKVIVHFLLYLAYFLYFIYCMYYRFGDEGSIFLLVATLLFVFVKCIQFIKSRKWCIEIIEQWTKVLKSDIGKKFKRLTRYSLYFVSGVGTMLFIIIDVLIEDPSKCQSFLGILCFIVITVLISFKPSQINWHPVYWGFILQFLFAIITLRTNIGYKAFKRLGDMVTDLVDFSNYGAVFLLGNNYKSFGFLFMLAATIIFMSSIVTLLIHLGVMDCTIKTLGSAMSYCLSTSPVESVVAVASIFVTTEQSALMVFPYLMNLSNSEVFAILTCGFASVAGSSLGTFVSLGAPANHLLAAAIISAPAGLAISKLMYPETRRVKKEQDVNKTKFISPYRNSFSAISEGATTGVKISASISGSMLSFVSVIKLMDAVISWFGRRAGVDHLTFTLICSYLFYPLVYLMGIETSDCRQAGALIAQKVFTSASYGYINLGIYAKNRQIFDNYLAMNNSTAWHRLGQDIVLENVNTTLANGVISGRSIAILTYAMCGYSSFFSIGVSIAMTVILLPARKSDILRLVFRSFIGGNIASFTTACIAGLLFTERSIAI